MFFLMLARRLRRRPNIKTTLGQCLVSFRNCPWSSQSTKLHVCTYYIYRPISTSRVCAPLSKYACCLWVNEEAWTKWKRSYFTLMWTELGKPKIQMAAISWCQNIWLCELSNLYQCSKIGYIILFYFFENMIHDTVMLLRKSKIVTIQL